MTRAATLTLLLAACGTPDAPVVLPPAVAVQDLALRRLSVAELDNVLTDLVGETTARAAVYLPPDTLQPFDNDVTYQTASTLWVEAIERLSADVAAEATATPAQVAALTGCAPTASAAACLDTWIPGLLRRALRRDLTPDEVTAYADLAHAELEASGELASAAQVLLRALLQDPELLYRTEAVRQDDPTRLDPYSVATRMAFLMWGSGPDVALLDDARAGRLDTADGRKEVAARMMHDRRAVRQAQRLHAMWLNYSVLTDDPAVVPLIRFEVDSLVERVLFTEQLPWSDLLVFPELPLFEITAMVYGVPFVRGEQHRWMDLSAHGRGGILSTMAFFSGSSRQSDTSPTLRGKLILSRLLCAPPPPPPSTVIADTPPPFGIAPCKLDRYAQHTTDPGCRSCHAQMDTIGAGLERYDKIGAYRKFDYYPYVWDINPACPLPDGATVPGIGTFRTPLELGQLLKDTGEPTACFVDHMVDYAFGNVGAVDTHALSDDLLARFRAAGERYDRLFIELAASDAFVTRQVTP
jgi:hypothetical protein